MDKKVINEQYVKKIVYSLLTEEVQRTNVVNAIKKRHEVSFKYDSGDGDNRGKQERITVQPVAYGTTSAGNLCFRGYQVNGSSETYEKGEKPLPGWRLFILDKVVSNTWRDSGKVFNEPPNFNPDGDKTMAKVLLVAKFSGTKERYEKGGLKKYNEKRKENNTAKDPYYYFKKNLAKAKQAPDFVQQNIANTEKSKERRQAEWDEANVQRGNQQSIKDMAKQKSFGDENYEETVGPQTKGKQEEFAPKNNINGTNNNNYLQAMKNGPQYKENNNEENLDNNEESE